MARTTKGSKGFGFEYWGPRPGCCESPGKGVKKFNRRLERHRAKQAVREGKADQLLKREAF